MASSKALVEDVNFILSECARMSDLVAQGDLKNFDRRDSMSCIPHPGGMGSMICGWRASQKLTLLAEAAAKRGGISGLVSSVVIRKELDSLFVDWFFKQKRTVDIKQVDRLLSSVTKACRRHFTSQTHFLPCHLTYTKLPAIIAVGPVIFHNRRSATSVLLKRRPPTAEARDLPPHARRLTARALKYCRNFRWLAEVRVVPCDTETFKLLAEEAATRALDALHILIGPQHTSRMQIGGLDVGHDRRATLSTTEDGNLQPSLSVAYLGAVGFDDSWSAFLEDAYGAAFLQMLGTALESVVDPTLTRPLSRRFLDAAQWFGEASRDTHPATKIVKFMTAIERILIPVQVENIAERLSSRIAALCLCPNENVDDTSFSEWRKRAKAAYDLRSRLVHGSISPNDLEVENGVDGIAEITQLTLLQIAFAMGLDAFRANKINESAIHNWLDEFVAKQATA
jgi:hypothetical protein